MTHLGHHLGHDTPRPGVGGGARQFGTCTAAPLWTGTHRRAPCAMLVPVRCFTCHAFVEQIEYARLLAEGRTPIAAFEVRSG